MSPPAVVLRGRDDSGLRKNVRLGDPRERTACSFSLALGNHERGERDGETPTHHRRPSERFSGPARHVQFSDRSAAVCEGPAPPATPGRSHKLTAYDAAYLDLAIRLALPLATGDGDLRKAAAAESVELLAQ